MYKKSQVRQGALVTRLRHCQKGTGHKLCFGGEAGSLGQPHLLEGKEKRKSGASPRRGDAQRGGRTSPFSESAEPNQQRRSGGQRAPGNGGLSQTQWTRRQEPCPLKKRLLLGNPQGRKG